MKHFIIRIFYFTIFTLCFIIIFNLLYKISPYSVVDKFYNYSHTNLLKKKDQIRNLFMGDSYIYYGINPKYLSKYSEYHNYAFPGEPIFNAFFKLKYLVEKEKFNEIQNIYLIGNSHMFIQESRLEFNFRFNDHYILSEYCDEFFWKLKFSSKVDYCLYFSDLLRLGADVLKTSAHNEYQNQFGFGMRQQHIDSITQFNIDEFKKNRTDINLNYKNETLEYYIKFNNFCKKNNINVVFLILPQAISLVNGLEERFVFERDTEAFLHKHFPHNKIINLASKNIPLTVNDFFDLGHMNVYGASKLTKFLDKEYLNIDLK